VHNFHQYHTATNHFYISRPIFLHRPTFDAWPEALQQEMRAAVTDAVAFQRSLKDQEEEDAAAAIREAGGEILELTPEEVEAFTEAIRPIYGEAQTQYRRELLDLVGL
jgi:TRAP-type C4-dicarboxylate transport system substrate-binding protein